MLLEKRTVLDLAEGEPGWLRSKRLAAWEKFAASTQLPFYKYGLSITTPLVGVDPEFLDGSGNSVSISGMVQSGPDERMYSLLPGGRHADMHKAFCNEFVFIRIPDGMEMKEPVLIRKLMGGKTFFSHVFISLGRNSRAVVLESLEGSGGYHSGGVEIFLDEGSSLLYGSSQNLSQETNNFSVRQASLSSGSRLEWVSVDIGSRLTLSRVGGRMEGRGSSILTKMMAFGSREQHFDFDVSAIHGAPDTSSDIVQRAALDGRAKMIFNGLVKIQKNAPRSDGRQKEDTLLLSPDAEASPIPNLEIDNNDVRCSHGTTVGQVDKDRIFYLMSRGLSEEQATRLAVKGFFEPLISSLPLDSLQESIRASLEKRLEERA